MSRPFVKIFLPLFLLARAGGDLHWDTRGLGPASSLTLPLL